MVAAGLRRNLIFQHDALDLLLLCDTEKEIDGGRYPEGDQQHDIQDQHGNRS